MKKIFTLIACIAASLMFGQSFSLYKMNNVWSSSSFTITNGSDLPDATVANSETKANLKLINNSASTVSLSLIRTVIYQNPVLSQNGSTVTPYTNFCFGNTCFPSNTYSTTSFDWTILGPSGSSASPFDNSHANAQDFVVYLEEGPAMGKYFVRYKIFNVNNANDTLSFTYKYNEFAGINEISNAIESVDLYPNPSTNLANVSVTLTRESPVKIQVYNSLGTVVYSNFENKLPGKNKLSVDCTNLSSGLYFVTITAGESKITKRLVVNK